MASKPLSTQTEFTLLEIAAIAVGGTQPKNAPIYHPTLNTLLEDARSGRLPLLAECTSSGYRSVVSRAATVGWLRGRGATLPPGLADPTTLEEALVILREHASRLELLEKPR